jgi:phosphate-selective porin OprO/OprP
VAALTLAGSSASGQTPSGPPERRWYWDDGAWLTAPNLKLKIGGQGQLDTAGFAGEDAPESGVEWRRARIYADLQVRKRLRFKLQWGLEGQPPRLKDAWMAVRLPKIDAYVRGGRMSSTFGLEKETGTSNVMFLESGLTAAFVPRQETGVLVHSQTKRRRWDISFSSGASEFECLLCDVLGVSGRFSTGFDFGTKTKRLHLGGNYSRRWVGSDETAQIKSRPESHLAPVLVDTGEIPSERVDTALVETAFISGRYSVQSETGWARVRTPDQGSLGFFAFYVYGTWILTGEMRPYDGTRGSIGRIRPKRELRDGKGGKGAFLVAARYSHIDLDDGDVSGGTLNDVSLALNWYPTRHAAALFNVIRAKREALEAVWIFQFRLQLAY